MKSEALPADTIELLGIPMRSNCILASLGVRILYGGHLVYWRPWSNGIREIPKHPWGHIYVRFDDGRQAHFKESTSALSWWQQVWFPGQVEVYPPKYT